VLTLTSNAPGEPRQVRIRWFGKSQPTLIPNALDVAMKVGVGESREVEVSYPAGDPPVPLEFVGASGLPGGVKVELIENNPAAIRAIPGLSASTQTAPSPFVGRAKLRVNFPAPTAPGQSAFESSVDFRQRGRAIEMPLRVSLEVHAGLRCQPDWLLFSARDAEALKQVRRSATLTSDNPGDQFTVVEKPAYLDVTLAPKNAGATTRAVVTASITATPPPGEANPRLVLADAEGRQVSVKLYVGVGP